MNCIKLFIFRTKNRIESAKWDGSDRRLVAYRNLKHPISLDVFGDNIYWVTRDTSEVFKQDKQGRGVPVLVQQLPAPGAVRVYQRSLYNRSAAVAHPCSDDSNPCSHLCLVRPREQGLYACSCPDDTGFVRGSSHNCDAPKEREKALPIKCPCVNGGHCVVPVAGGFVNPADGSESISGK